MPLKQASQDAARSSTGSWWRRETAACKCATTGKLPEQRHALHLRLLACHATRNEHGPCGWGPCGDEAGGLFAGGGTGSTGLAGHDDSSGGVASHGVLSSSLHGGSFAANFMGDDNAGAVALESVWSGSGVF